MCGPKCKDFGGAWGVPRALVEVADGWVGGERQTLTPVYAAPRGVR